VLSMIKVFELQRKSVHQDMSLVGGAAPVREPFTGRATIEGEKTFRSEWVNCFAGHRRAAASRGSSLRKGRTVERLD
jgi:hypothetical protein